MANMIRLIDFASASAILGKNRDAHLRMFDEAGDRAEGLRVKIRATNSGSLVNNRVYPGVHMKEAVDSWTKPYPRPILTHHADGGGLLGPPAKDPKGRVMDAEFTQLRKGRAFDNDYKRPQPGGMGSGFITVEALISDQDAVQKVLDGRYLTVSSSQSTTAMHCSICGQDWFSDYCEHSPGRTYEMETGRGKNKTTREYQCYGITGPLVYRELSFVNVPAQPNAQVLGVLEKDTQDNLQMLSWSDRNAIASMALCDAEGQIISDLTSEEELQMAEASKKVYIEMPGIEDEDVLDKEDLEEDQNVDDDSVTNDGDDNEDLEKTSTPDDEDQSDDADDVPAQDDSADDDSEDSEDDVDAMSDEDFALANVAKSIKDNGLWLDKKDTVQFFDGETRDVEIEDATHSHLMYIQKTEDGRIVGRTYATIGESIPNHDHVIEIGDKEDPVTRDADSGLNHVHEFEVEWDEDPFDDSDVAQLVAYLEEESEKEDDAKLSPEQRKKLKASDFCGPNRSFPVSDCAHVTAARRLIGRYKGDAATKARIMRCVERKAKKMSCGGGTKKNKKKSKKDEDLQKGVVMKAHRDEALEQVLLDLAHFKAQSKLLETSLSEKSTEIQALEDDLAKAKSDNSKVLARSLGIIRMIIGHSDCEKVDTSEKFDELVLEYAKRTADSLQDAVSDHLEDLDEALSKLRKIAGDGRIVAPAASSKDKKPLNRQESSRQGKRSPTRRASKVDQLDEDLTK